MPSGLRLGLASDSPLRAAARLVDLVLPERCAACGVGETIVCPGCKAALTLLAPPLCARCGAPTAWPVERCSECAGRRVPFATAHAAVAYDGLARELVAAWKERGLRKLGRELAELVAAAVPPPTANGVVFVPGDVERTLWRGQNAAEGLARLLAHRWNLPVLPLLARRSPAPRQRGLSRADRRANVRGAFEARAAPPARVVLVDDVYTTGATVAAAARELKRAGARRVEVVTFARVLRR